MTYVSLGCSCATAFQLNKLNLRKESYPFDWCKISIRQLNLVLENDFNDFGKIDKKKWSDNHNSYIAENKYKCQFAHEIINDLENKMEKRIDRFKRLKNPIFIRFENSRFSKNYQNELDKLIKYLNKIFYEPPKLILIIPDNYEINVKVYKIIKFHDFDPDWKYDNINWDLIHS